MKTISRMKRGEVDGPFYEQAMQINDAITEWFAEATFDYVRVDQQYVVIEDFVLQRKKRGGATGNLTSCWVAGGLHTLLEACPKTPIQLDYQQPVEMRFATPARMKMWGLWQPTVGQQHARAAARHWAAAVNKLVR
jgi:hypothetical protein